MFSHSILSRPLFCASVASSLFAGVAASADTEVPAEKPKASGVFSIYVENDTFAGTDQHYSNGLRISYLTPSLRKTPNGEWESAVANAFPPYSGDDLQKHFGFSFGQNIYTPEDIEAEVLLEDDRPYAGWSYFGFSLISKNTAHMDLFELQIGLVGRHSYAQEAQVVFHEWVDGVRPNGWKHQLEDEPGVNLMYERRWRLAGRTLGESIGFDFIPNAGVSLGNVQTYAKVGAEVRVGLNLPADYGTGAIQWGTHVDAPIDNGEGKRFWNKVGLHVLAGAEGRAVARDIFLDGNTFADSHSVDKYPLVADIFGGVGLGLGKVKCTAKWVHRTREFQGQDDPAQFGSITFSVAF